MQTFKLTCPNCGGRPEVDGDMERFACGYCGLEQIVMQRGGTVSIKPITEAVARVQRGTDRTAAELAIPRLESEISELEAACRSLAHDRYWVLFYWSVLCFFLEIVALVLARELAVLVVPLWLVMGGVIYYLWGSRFKIVLEDQQSQLHRKRRMLHEQRRIVDS